jgi:hypothetical protein
MFVAGAMSNHEKDYFFAQQVNFPEEFLRFQMAPEFFLSQYILVDSSILLAFWFFSP